MPLHKLYSARKGQEEVLDVIGGGVLVPMTRE